MQQLVEDSILAVTPTRAGVPSEDGEVGEETNETAHLVPLRLFGERPRWKFHENEGMDAEESNEKTDGEERGTVLEELPELGKGPKAREDQAKVVNLSSKDLKHNGKSGVASIVRRKRETAVRLLADLKNEA